MFFVLFQVPYADCTVVLETAKTRKHEFSDIYPLDSQYFLQSQPLYPPSDPKGNTNAAEGATRQEPAQSRSARSRSVTNARDRPSHPSGAASDAISTHTALLRASHPYSSWTSPSRFRPFENAKVHPLPSQRARTHERDASPPDHSRATPAAALHDTRRSSPNCCLLPTGDNRRQPATRVGSSSSLYSTTFRGI